MHPLRFLVALVALGFSSLMPGNIPAQEPAAPAMLELLTPANDTDLESAPAEFSWKPAAAKATYQFRLVSVKATQLPAVALDKEKPLLETETDGVTLAYPDAAPKLAAGQLYAWRVVAVADGKPIASAARHFRVRFEGQKVTRQEAIRLVMQKYVVPATVRGHVETYLALGLLRPDDIVEPFDEPELRRKIAAPTWFAWIDDKPQAFFAHPTRYVLIDAATGKSEVIAAQWWPTLNEESLFMSDAEKSSADLVIYSTILTEEVSAP